MDADRTTAELMQILGNDVDRCHRMLLDEIDRGEVDSDGSVTADYEFAARQLVRAVFAYIEAVTFSVKASSAARCLDRGIELSDPERFLATDVEHDINEKGEVVQTPAKISLAKNVRFAIALNRRASGVSEPFAASAGWWSSFRAAVRVRDRLTRPKFPSDLDLSGDDILNVLRAKRGFEGELLSHPPGDAS